MKHRNLCYGDGSFSPEPFTTAVRTILTHHRGSRRATFTGASSRKHHQNHHHRLNIAEHDAPRCTLKQRGLSLLAVPPLPPEPPAQEEGEGLTSQPGPSTKCTAPAAAWVLPSQRGFFTPSSDRPTSGCRPQNTFPHKATHLQMIQVLFPKNTFLAVSQSSSLFLPENSLKPARTQGSPPDPGVIPVLETLHRHLLTYRKSR